MIFSGFPYTNFRRVVASLLIIAVVLLGAAAKRSQFPSADSAPAYPSHAYLSKAVKMVEVRFQETVTAILIPSPSSQCIESLSVPDGVIAPRPCIQQKPLRIELQSPPLLV